MHGIVQRRKSRLQEGRDGLGIGHRALRQQDGDNPRQIMLGDKPLCGRVVVSAVSPTSLHRASLSRS